MDQRIVDQLDMLERGARIQAQPARSVYDNSSAEFSAYDIPEHGYSPRQEDGQNDEYIGPEFGDQPMVLDSFGKFHG